MPTTNPVPSQDPSDLLFNAGKLDEVLNGTGTSFTDRLGTARRTVAGMNADFDAQLADAESDLNVYRADAAASAAQALGYLNTIRTTSYGAYSSDPATDPLGNPPNVGDEYFNTTSNLLKRFNGTTWQASDINTANLAASSGSSLVGYDGQTVQDVLDGAKSLQDYAALRAYTGRAKRIYITGLLATAKPAGIAGTFQYDPTDTTSSDNGGTIIVGSDGRRWKRDYSGNAIIDYFEPAADGVTNDSAKINESIQALGYALLKPGASYKISSLTIPVGCSIFSSEKRANLILDNPDSSAINLLHTASASNLNIYLPGGATSDEVGAIAVYTSAASTRVYADNISVYGTGLGSANGHAIVLLGSTGSASYSVFQNIYAERVNSVVKAKVTGAAYSNGHVFENIVARSSVRLCDLESGSEANQFNGFAWNQGSVSKEVIQVATNFNDFNGWFFDLNAGTIPNVAMVIDGADTAGNKLTSNLSDESYFIDNSTAKANNYRVDRQATAIVMQGLLEMPSIWMSSTEAYKFSYQHLHKPYTGHQENYLAFADKLHSVTMPAVQPDVSIANIFNPFAQLSTGKPTWSLVTGQTGEIVIEFLDTIASRRLDFFQIVFATGGAHARNISLDFWNGSAWAPVAATSTNDRRYFQWHGTSQGIGGGVSSPSKIRAVFSDPANAVAGSGSVKVESLIARSLAVAGTSFLPRNGGKVVGDLNLNGNNLFLGRKTFLPTATEALRGATIVLDGASGVSDKVYTCLKQANDTYAWTQLS